MLLKTKFDTYDININEDGKRIISLYETYITNVNEKKEKVFKTQFIEDIYPENLEDMIKELRNVGYYSLKELNIEKYSIDCTSLLASYIFALFGYRIKPLEKVYFPEIAENMSILIGALIYVDLITGKEYFIRTNNLGLETSEKVQDLVTLGYKNICNTILMNQIDVIDGYFPRTLKK